MEALDGLAERFGASAEGHFDALREQLEQENRAAHDDGSVERAMSEAAAGLAAGRSRIDALPLKGDGWELIGPGLHRTYRRGRKRLRTVEEEASVTNLHELRKRVKDLWYQVRLIGDADKHMLGPLADHAHDLSDHLGDDHDLVLLRETVQRRRAAFADPATSATCSSRSISAQASCSSRRSRSASASTPTSLSAPRSASRTAGRPGGSGSPWRRAPQTTAALRL